MIPLLNSNGRRLFCLRRISDGVVINPRAVWPTSNELDPIPGLDPDYEYLPIQTDAVPDYDPRLFQLVKDEAKVLTEWHITYTTPAREAEEAKINALNTEQVENARHYKEQERDKLMILGLGVLFRLIANQQLTNKEIALKTKVVDAAVKIWRNDQRLRDIITALDAGQTPDLDSGWEPAP